MADMMYGTAGAGGDVSDDHANDFYAGAAAVIPNAAVGGFVAPAAGLVGASMYNNTGQPPRPRYPGLYVGNLTWWTTDRDVVDAINSIGVTDVQEVKFFENRNNGQSKGFCVVTFNSDASLPLVMEKLPTKELHGQNPVVAPYNRQNLNLFESQNKMIGRPPMNSTNGPTAHAAGIMGINSIAGVHPAAVANPQLATAVANIPYAGVAAAGVGAAGLGYNQAALGMNSLGPRAPYHMRMQMARGPRPMMGGGMNNGPMMGGGMNRMGFIPRLRWNNSQGMAGGGGGYQANRVGGQMNMDMSSRQGGLGGGLADKQDDLGSHMQGGGGGGSSSYYNSHHSNSQSDHYSSSRSDIRDHRDHHRDLRDERDSRRLDDRPSRTDDRMSRLDERSSRLDERSSRLDERSLRHDDSRLAGSRDHDRPSRLVDDRMPERSRRSPDLRSSTRGRIIEDDRGGLRRGGLDIDRRERDDRSARRDDKPVGGSGSGSGSSRHHRSHRSDERARSRSRSKERSSRLEASSKGSERRDRDRDRDRDSSRKERY